MKLRQKLKQVKQNINKQNNLYLRNNDHQYLYYNTYSVGNYDLEVKPTKLVNRIFPNGMKTKKKF